MQAGSSTLFPAQLRAIKLITLAKVAKVSSLLGGLANNWSRDVISTKSTRMPAKMILNQLKSHAKNYTIATARLPQSLESWLREYASRGRMCPFVWKEAGYSDWSCTDTSRMRFPLNVRLRNWIQIWLRTSCLTPMTWYLQPQPSLVWSIDPLVELPTSLASFPLSSKGKTCSTTSDSVSDHISFILIV